MKSNRLLMSAFVLLMMFGFQFSFATSGGGSVMGRVTDPNTKALAADVVVVFDCQGNQLAFTTNDSGYYYAGNVPAGLYTVTASFMSNQSVVKGVKVSNDAQITVDIELSADIAIHDIIYTDYRNPLIDPYQITTAKLERSDFTKLAITKVAELTDQQPGVADINGVFYVKGAREGALAYYVDGGLVMNANNNIPLCGLDTYEIYSGFIPPKYGDTVGGVVVLETRNYFTASH